MSRGRAQDNTGARPDLGAELLHASGRGDAAAVRRLLALNAPVNRAGVVDASESQLNLAQCQEYTPLLYAAQHGHAECVRLLLAAHASVLRVSSPGGVTALWLAAVGGHAECVELLLAANTSAFEACDENASLPLMDLSRRLWFSGASCQLSSR